MISLASSLLLPLSSSLLPPPSSVSFLPGLSYVASSSRLFLASSVPSQSFSVPYLPCVTLFSRASSFFASHIARRSLLVGDFFGRGLTDVSIKLQYFDTRLALPSALEPEFGVADVDPVEFGKDKDDG